MFVKIILAIEKMKGPKSPYSTVCHQSCGLQTCRECHNNVGCTEYALDVEKRCSNFFCIYVRITLMPLTESIVITSPVALEISLYV